jgi:acetylornithine deacetylase/succinyl-diaminopimelate desuccinylase-like protein
MAPTPQAYLQTHRERLLDELIAFARIPSVSTDPAYATGMAQAAAWVADRLRAAGVPRVEIMPTARHPVIYGEWLAVPGRPTMLIYGHYDVQPPDPLDKWASAPFSPGCARGGSMAAASPTTRGLC